jgi:hypothetical protein
MSAALLMTVNMSFGSPGGYGMVDVILVDDGHASARLVFGLRVPDHR